jgi:XTP/dITP diphosphohydrolase
MDRLRSPGGCPWDAAQTHESLTRYLLEETYEVLEALESGDRALLREELGDLLLQVLFHARIEEEHPDSPFGIDDVATDLADKLVRRHPHVFGEVVAGSPTELNEVWERQKIEEKGRTSAVDGVPLNQPALALAAKLVARAQRAGISAATGDGVGGEDGGGDPESAIGEQLFAVVVAAVAAGVDPEAALRRRARGYRAHVQRVERDANGA